MEMDVSRNQVVSAADSDASTNVAARNSMPMSIQPVGVASRFEPEMNPQMGTGSVPHPSQNLSSCAHEPCNQTSVSVSPPTGNRGHLSFPNLAAVCAANMTSPSIGIDWLRPGASPPENFLAESKLVTLRI
jgi:hypothetical protein